MIRFLKFLITGSWHEHHYVNVEKISVYDSGNPNAKMPIAFEYIIQCKECGKIKKKRIG